MGAGWEHLTIKKWLWPKPVFLWLACFDSALSGRLWEDRPNDEKCGFKYFWHFARWLVWWLVSGEVLFQEFKCTANLGKWCSSLAYSHTCHFMRCAGGAQSSSYPLIASVRIWPRAPVLNRQHCSTPTSCSVRIFFVCGSSAKEWNDLTFSQT